MVCLCKPNDADRFARLILKHTTSFGVRRNILKRYTLDREVSACGTKCGSLRIKSGSGYGAEKKKIEYDDAAEAAKKHGVDIFTLYGGI